MAVLYVDLDDFKLVNDSFGHGAGDELLCEVANRLRLSTRASDVVARQGGDEFLILIADVDVDDQRTLDIGEVARKVAEEVREAVSRPMVLAETEIYTSASLGISLWPVDASDATTLLKHADIAMYKAKESGRDQYQLFTATGRDPRAQLSMAGRLRGAVERDELMLHYQPIVALQSGEIVGAEALLRWQDGDRGVVMPGEFIPLAERTGLIAALSDWVIEEACRQGARWRERGIDVYVSVNLPRDLLAADRDAPGAGDDRVVRPVGGPDDDRDHRVHGDGRRAALEPIIAELHERGLRLAIDDFGTGHSSLSRLNQMQVTTLKIDRSFIADLPADRSAAVLVTSIVAAGQEPGPAAAGRGHRDRGAARIPGRPRLPAGPGLPVLARPCRPSEMERLYLRSGGRPRSSAAAILRAWRSDHRQRARAGARGARHGSPSPRVSPSGSRWPASSGNAFTYDMAFLRLEEIDPTDLVTRAERADRGLAGALRERAGRRDHRLDGSWAAACVIDNPNTPEPAFGARAGRACRGTVQERVAQVIA